jgi:hypothetical protein
MVTYANGEAELQSSEYSHRAVRRWTCGRIILRDILRDMLTAPRQLR